MKTLDSVLAERDEALAELAALRAALKWATKSAIHQTYNWQQCCGYCLHCAATVVAIDHAADCPVRVLAETMTKVPASP